MGTGGKVSYSGHAVDDWRDNRRNAGLTDAGVYIPDGKYRCKYCDARFPQTEDNCPKCGAGV